MYTILAIIITLIPCAFLVIAETREEEKKEEKEQEEIKHLNFFLNKCAESRMSEENKRRL